MQFACSFPQPEKRLFHRNGCQTTPPKPFAHVGERRTLPANLAKYSDPGRHDAPRRKRIEKNGQRAADDKKASGAERPKCGSYMLTSIRI